MRIVRSPVRVSIGGGGTDLPIYCEEKGGDLMFATINKYVYIVVNQKLDDKYSISLENAFEEVNKLDNSSDKYVRTIFEKLDLDAEGLSISSISDVPSGTGLGSSGSFTVSMLKALEEYSSKNYGKRELAETAFQIENEELGKSCGKQDQYAAAFGRLKRLEISKNQEVSVSELDIDKSDLNKLQESLMLFYTDERRYSDEVLEDQKKEMKEKERKLKKMDEIKNIGHQIRRELEKGNIDIYGKLLDMHWAAKKKFSKGMTNPSIDEMYSCAKKNGAIGGKIVGAGGGGFLMLYVPVEDHYKVKENLENLGAKHMSFKFSQEGCEVVYED